MALIHAPKVTVFRDFINPPESNLCVILYYPYGGWGEKIYGYAVIFPRAHSAAHVFLGSLF